MRFSRLALPIAAVLFASCVAIVDAPHPQPDIQLSRVFPRFDEAVVWGPMPVSYELTVFNPTDHVLVVRGIDIHSISDGPYYVASQRQRVEMAVLPHDSARMRVRVSAWAHGGEASAYEPVTLRGSVWYDFGGRTHRVPFECTP